MCEDHPCRYRLEEYIESSGKSCTIRECCRTCEAIVECEGETVSRFSQGRVENDELLAFLLIDPNHFDPETNKVLPSAAQEIFRRDLSVLRTKFGRLDEFEFVKHQIEQRDVGFRTVNRVSAVAAGAYRGVTVDDRRRVVILDTAFEDVTSHASLVGVNVDSMTKAQKTMVRTKIADIMDSNQFNVNDVF